MKFGILGGAFDPIHYGHIAIATSCLAILDSIIFIPSGNPPHKGILTPSQMRISMINIALENQSEYQNRLFVDDYETRQSDITYTYKTIEYLQDKYPNDELSLIIGYDQVLKFHTWKNPTRILELAKIIAIYRNDGNSKEQIVYPDFVYKSIDLDMDISSSTIRSMVVNRQCEQLEKLTPVSKYILDNGLYR